jgi:hypothetical protein
MSPFGTCAVACNDAELAGSELNESNKSEKKSHEF